MADFINTVDLLGDDALTDSLITGSLTTFADDSITTLANYAFYGKNMLTSVDLPAVTSVGSFVVNGCTALAAFILRSSTIVTIAYNSFMQSAIYSGTGYIYVPSALVDSYKAASNWSTYANQIRALEDYTVDGTTTGELDPSKI